MVAEKVISRALGESDLAFRLLLLPVGLAALVLFLWLAERLLDGYAVPFAVATFAIGAPFIRYSAEIKPYGIDIAAMIALSLIALRLRDPDSTAVRCALGGIVGATLVWFSLPTVFVLAGIGGALLLAWRRNRDPQTGRALLLAVPIWGIAAAAATLVAIHRITPATRAHMDQFWRYRNGFFPQPFSKPGDVFWLWDRVLELFADPTTLRYRWPALYGVLVILGLIVLWRRNRFGALVLLGPFALAVLAAVDQQFPLNTRVALYLLPILILAVAQGAEWLRRQASRLHPAAAGVCMAALFVVPAWAFVQTPPPYWIEDHKTALAFFREHRQPGDAVFVFPYGVQAVERYGSAYGLAPDDYQVGACSREDRRVFLRDVDRYRGRRRVWLLSASVPSMTAARESLEMYLATIGVRKESISIPSEKPLDPVSAQVFDLSDPARLAAASAETFLLVPPEPLAPLPRCGDRVEPLR
jgi:hypothetical protein